MPLTRQTSPWIVQTAASPFEKKSKPPMNISAFHGLSYGTVSVSTTYGPFSLLTYPFVVSGVHRALVGVPMRFAETLLEDASDRNFGSSLRGPVQRSAFARDSNDSSTRSPPRSVPPIAATAVTVSPRFTIARPSSTDAGPSSTATVPFPSKDRVKETIPSADSTHGISRISAPSRMYESATRPPVRERPR